MLSNGIVFGLLGLFVGFVLTPIFDAGNISLLVGTLCGFLAGIISSIYKDQKQLQYKVGQLEEQAKLHSLSAKPNESQEVSAQEESPEVPDTPTTAATERLNTEITPVGWVEDTKSNNLTTKSESQEQPALVLNKQHQVEAEDNLAKKIDGHIRAFFTEGNVLVKIGLIVLFFGIGFLLKYASDHSLLPIELRLAGVALGGIALLVLGWKLRNKKQLYALLLQGGGIGILYLTIYASSKLYGLLPHSFSFALMFLLVILSSLLAILQNARALAQYATAGGFLAPILLSTGTGSHVMLFSYYLILNIGILTIAWFYSWRSLNLLGFLFTFIIGTAWGVFSYRPEDFSTVEPFLIIFFLLFATISVLYATRQPPELKGYVDGTLVFGLPIISFALQAAIVERFEYGLAYSAFAMSAFYITIASVLWKRRYEGMRLLCEAFLATGVVFGSLAIPLALDGQWSSAAWSIEGVGLLWVGLRQQRILARSFSLLLLFGGGVLLLNEVSCGKDLVIFNICFIGAFLVSFAALLSSYLLSRYPKVTQQWEKSIAIILFVWGLLWWYWNGLNEIFIYHNSNDLPLWLLLFFTGSMLIQFMLAKKLDWYHMYTPLYIFLPTLWLLFGFSQLENSHPFVSFNFIGWLTAFTGQYFLLYQMDKQARIKGIPFLHMASLWLLLLLVSTELTWHVVQIVPENNLWSELSWILLTGLVLYSIANFSKYLRWPVYAHFELYLCKASLPIALILVIASAAMGLGSPGSPQPLSYIPLLNPLDISVVLTIIILINWHGHLNKMNSKAANLVTANIRLKLIAITSFLWITGIVARTVHYWFNISYTTQAIFKSVVFQTSISVVWTIIALAITVIATRKKNRYVWFAGAGLLGVVVAKLFLVDLANTGTISQIISFVAVGLLMLIIGYFSPLPPHRERVS